MAFFMQTSSPALTTPDLDFSEGLGHKHDGVETDDKEDESFKDQGLSQIPEHSPEVLNEVA